MVELDFTWENLDEAFQDFIQDEVTPIVRGLTVSLWNDVLQRTPQYYGRLVASWSYSVGSPEFVDRSQELEAHSVMSLDDGAQADWVGELKSMTYVEMPGLVHAGHPRGIAIANQHSTGREMLFRLGQTVWFANGADHGEGSYSQYIEDVDASMLRPENHPGHAVRYSIGAFEGQYGELVSAPDAQRLTSLHIRG